VRCAAILSMMCSRPRTNMNYAINDEPMSEEEWVKRFVTEH
jgi:hypothetical protein